jgi:hypothetical protein
VTDWTRDDVVRRLKAEQGGKSLRQFAKVVGCSAAFLSDVYNGKREPGPKLLERFGLTKQESVTVVYVGGGDVETVAGAKDAVSVVRQPRRNSHVQVQSDVPAKRKPQPVLRGSVPGAAPVVPEQPKEVRAEKTGVMAEWEARPGFSTERCQRHPTSFRSGAEWYCPACAKEM